MQLKSVIDNKLTYDASLYTNSKKPEESGDFKNILSDSTGMKEEQEENKKSKTTADAIPSEIYKKIVLEKTESKAPYSQLADENGLIHYNGVTYVCNYKKNELCLGDVSDPEKIITIPLSGGGCLKVNRENLDDLSSSIGMFSPEDIKRILHAISTDKKSKNKQMEIEQEIINTINKIVEN